MNGDDITKSRGDDRANPPTPNVKRCLPSLAILILFSHYFKQEKKIRRKILFSPKLFSFLFQSLHLLLFKDLHEYLIITKDSWLGRDIGTGERRSQITSHRSWVSLMGTDPKSTRKTQIHSSVSTSQPRGQNPGWESGASSFFRSVTTAPSLQVPWLSPLSRRIKSPAHYPALGPGWHQTDHVNW